MALLLGGGTTHGLPSDAVIQVAALALLPFVAERLSARALSPSERQAIAASLLVLGVPLVQLIPLPFGLWAYLPGRQDLAESFALIGAPVPWLPISVDPGATFRSLLGLIPGWVLFLATLSLGSRERRWLVLVAVAVGLLSVMLGLAQFGGNKDLLFYVVTNLGVAVGFFANSNHFAALLYVLFPLVAAWVVGLIGEGWRERIPGIAFSGVVLGSLLLGLGLSQSRAGLFLSALSLVGSAVLVWLSLRQVSLGRGARILFGTGMAAALVAALLTFAEVARRVGDRESTDYRSEILHTTLDAVGSFSVFGAGFGTFPAIYEMFEKPDVMRHEFINRAHNDWIEIVLEGGALAVVVAAIVLAWFARASFRAWLRPVGQTAIDIALVRAASLSCALLMLHSLVDYPARTTAIMGLIGVFFALLTPRTDEPALPRARRKGGHGSRHHRASKGIARSAPPQAPRRPGAPHRV